MKMAELHHLKVYPFILVLKHIQQNFNGSNTDDSFTTAV